MNYPTRIAHPCLSRRETLQIGGIGLLGLTLPGVNRQRALAAATSKTTKPKNVVYIFLPGGPPQHETFDPKPDAPDIVRGELKAIQTATPGMMMCELLPQLAARSDKLAILRSVHHHSNDHIAGTTIMACGDTAVPSITPTDKQPSVEDTPGIAALAGYFRPGRNHLPSAAVLPEYVGRGSAGSGQIAPGQTAGRLGSQHDPWLIKAASGCYGWGPCPDCFNDGDDDAVFAFGLQHDHIVPGPVFDPPSLRLPNGLTQSRLGRRLSLLESFEKSRGNLEQYADAGPQDSYREQAVALLTSERVRAALDLSTEDDKVLETYGRDKFGWSLLLTRRLIEAGVNMVQVSLGRHGTWDLHRRMYPLLKDYLLPQTDRSVSAFLDDMSSRNLLDDTLVIMCGEFGRTPKLSAPAGRRVGRDHWGPLQSIMFAGGGVNGGSYVGSSDSIGGYPKDLPKTPEDFAATIFDALGIPEGTMYQGVNGRPHHVYLGSPIRELFA